MPTDSVVSYSPGRKFIKDVSNRNVIVSLTFFQNADEVIHAVSTLSAATDTPLVSWEQIYATEETLS